MNKNKLKSVIAKLLREADEEDAGKEDEKVDKEKGTDSLDNQVDKYLADYESEAKGSKTEGYSYGAIARRFLSEADDDDIDIGKLTAEDIDVESFANSVMRLVDNYDSLLEVEHTLLRRATNFLSKNYEEDVVESFKEVLQETHGVDVEKSKSDEDDGEGEAPTAAEAGPAGGGGGAIA